MSSIISYAQNFEDVMLWRALKHVENGFYIDLGAQDPVIDSVSLAFHEHGWKGVHVEPTPHYAQMLRAQRPGDTVIEAAVADETGLITFFEIPETGISTGDPQIAQQHREQGFEIREITVPCVRLASIFKSCGARDIHWLKIDVEGFELSALASWGKSAVRPWIVVVESTLPMSQIDSHKQWESLLLKKGYTHAYFDGLNRYYVSRDKAELKHAFCAPPNVFDGFWLSGTASAVFHLEINNRHNAEMAAIGVQMAHATTEIADLTHTLKAREAAHIELERAHQARFDAEMAEWNQREQAHRTEISSLQTEVLRGASSLVAAKDEFSDLLHNAHQDALRSAHYLAGREREFSVDVAAREQIHSNEISALRAEIARASTLLSTAWDDFAGQLQVARQDALKSAHYLAAREQEFSAQVAALEQTRSSESSAFQAELTRTNSLLVSAKDEIAGVLQVMHREALKYAQALAEHESEAGARLVAQQKEFRDSLAAAQQESARQLQAVQREAESERQQLSESVNKLNAEHHQRLSMQSEAHAEELRFLRSETQMRELNAQTQAQVELDNYRQQLAVCYQSLERLRVEANAMRSSLSWRITAPARKIASLLGSAKTEDTVASIDVIAAPSQFPHNTDLIAASPQLPSPPIFIENNMQPTPNTGDPGAVASRPVGRGIQSIDDLEFVQSAYELVLGRSADPGGKAHCLERLRDGCSRLYVLAQLRLSPEGEVCVANLPQIDAQLAMVTNAKAVVTTIEELLDLQGRTFVRAAYLSLLGREPDAGGMENCVAQLLKGATKTEILEQLWLSEEAQLLNAKIQKIRDAIHAHIVAQESTSESIEGLSKNNDVPQVSTSTEMEDLFDCPVQDFLCRAFALLLGRMPDPKAFGTYAGHLDAGVSRIQLLAAIQASPEAANRASFLNQIELAIRQPKSARTPFLDAVARIFSGDNQKHDAIPRKFHALEFENALALETASQRFAQVDLEIDSLKEQFRELANQTSKMLDNIELSINETPQQAVALKQSSLRDQLVHQTLAWKSGARR